MHHRLSERSVHTPHRRGAKHAPAKSKTCTASAQNPHRPGAKPAPPRGQTRTAAVQNPHRRDANPHRPGAKPAPLQCRIRIVPEQNPHRRGAKPAPSRSKTRTDSELHSWLRSIGIARASLRLLLVAAIFGHVCRSNCKHLYAEAASACIDILANLTSVFSSLCVSVAFVMVRA